NQLHTQNRISPDDVPAQHDKSNVAANDGHSGNDVGADGHSPKSKLVPGQEITRVAEEQRGQKKNDTDHPVEFVWRFVASAVEHVKHVPEDGEDHTMRGLRVIVPEKH